MREIELKLELDEAQEKRLRTAPALKLLGEGRPRTETLHSIYYDTESQDLRRAGIALRLRKAGRRWTQTVKQAARPMRQGLSEPKEDECAVPGSGLRSERIADDDLRERVIEAERIGLRPLVETRFRRTRRNLRTPGGGLVEFAIDVGEVAGGGRAAPLIEAELELKEGRTSELYELAARLLDRGPVRFSNVSKSERALRLMNETSNAPCQPRKARTVDLSADETVETAAAAILSEALAHYMANVALLLETDHIEGPHQVRVALRRLRSALSAFRDVLGAGAVKCWADAARDLGAEVGALRDLDVLAEELVAPVCAATPAEETGFAALTAALAARRAETRRIVRDHLASPEITRWGLVFAAFLVRRGWLDPDHRDQMQRLARPVEPFARQVLDKRWKKAADYGRRIADLTTEERHEMRKELKKLRYMIEAFRRLYDAEAVRGFLTRLKALQKGFGALNDVAMADAALTETDGPGAVDVAGARAAGRVLGRLDAEAGRLWPETVAGWKALTGTPKFWR